MFIVLKCYVNFLKMRILRLKVERAPKVELRTLFVLVLAAALQQLLVNLIHRWCGMYERCCCIITVLLHAVIAAASLCSS